MLGRVKVRINCSLLIPDIPEMQLIQSISVLVGHDLITSQNTSIFFIHLPYCSYERLPTLARLS